MPDKITAVAWALLPRFARAVMVSSSASLKTLAFPLPAKLTVRSAPLKAWRPGEAATFVLPRASTMGFKLITRYCGPVPETKCTSLQSCGYLLKEGIKTRCLSNRCWFLMLHGKKHQLAGGSSWCPPLPDSFLGVLHPGVLLISFFPRPQRHSLPCVKLDPLGW